GGFSGGGFAGVSGEITKIDGDTITIETEDGQTYQIEVGQDTAVTLSGDASDLTEGDSITVIGDVGDDGTITDPRAITEGTSSGFMPGGFGGGFGGDAPPTQPGADGTRSRNLPDGISGTDTGQADT
ncbi:MAG: hypothetical protein LBU05_00245, partial [Bifidobacteriaceae bacterium]|nr:hypothetical protein [Bifidobacteriaceae bacterium]